MSDFPDHNKAALLILNQGSRKGGDTCVRDAIAVLERSGLDLIRAEPTNRDETEQVIDANRDRIDRVIVAGGDGTINSAAAAIYRNRLALAILPLGTANDLARTLGIPENLSIACTTIIENHRHHVDLGVVNDCFFFNVANIGLGTQITHELTPDVKKYWGIFSYLKALITAYSRTRQFRATLIVDYHEYRIRSIQIAVGNGRYYGGGNVVDEEASIDNGMLFLYSLKPQTFWELFTLAPLLREGKQSQMERTFTTSGTRIEVRTSRPMQVHGDGEPLTRTPAVFEVIEGALEVLVPKNRNAS
ncbi:MAG: lipid kinase [Desulforhopalus sp.]